MGGLMSRNKGKRAEREVVQLLQPIVDKVYSELKKEPPILQRNTLQSDRGGFDLVGIEFLAIEVKMQEQFSLETWWMQTLKQARHDQLPVLFFRKSRVPWKVMTQVHLPLPEDGRYLARVELTKDEFLGYFEMLLKSLLIRGMIKT